MKLNKTIGAISIAAALALSGCGSSGSNSGAGDNSRLAYLDAMTQTFEKDILNLKNNWQTDPESLMTKSHAEKVAALIGGCFGIADEVGAGKISDPIEADNDHTTYDITKVESQYSWNSTADFYNNIYSVKKVWDAGLKDLVELAGKTPAQTAVVTDLIDTALAEIAEISNLTGHEDAVKGGTHSIAQADAFRNRMQTDAGNAQIVQAQNAVVVLAGALNNLSTYVTTAAATGILNDPANNDAIVGHLTPIGVGVIKATYQTMATNATGLKNAVAALKADPTAANVTAARNAWKLVRAPWESSEAYIVDTAPSIGDATDGNCDSWPVPSAADIENNLAAWDGQVSTIETTDGEVKGFHAIEYFLFGGGTAVESAADAVTRLTAD